MRLTPLILTIISVVSKILVFVRRRLRKRRLILKRYGLKNVLAKRRSVSKHALFVRVRL